LATIFQKTRQILINTVKATTEAITSLSVWLMKRQISCPA